MAARSIAFAVLALLLAGCSAPPPPAPVPPTAPSPPSPPPTGEVAEGPGPEVLVNGENARIRVVLADHRVAGEEATLTLDIRNKDASRAYVFGYGILAYAQGDTYFDLPGRVDGGNEARFTSTSRDDAAGLRSPWANLSLYFQVHSATGEHTNDDAVLLDLRGRGLPTNVA